MSSTPYKRLVLALAKALEKQHELNERISFLRRKVVRCTCHDYDEMIRLMRQFKDEGKIKWCLYDDESPKEEESDD